MFFSLMKAVDKLTPLEKVGFYAADSKFFNQFKQEFPEIESEKYSLLKEWEIIKDSDNIQPDIAILEKYEQQFGDPFLWDALVADRRIYFGKKYAYNQDYIPRFNHEQMLSILQVGLTQVEELFDKVNPDFIVSFQCVTLGEYLSYLIAKNRSIPILNLRPTRIRNRFYAGESILEPTESLKNSYQHFLSGGIEFSLQKEAAEYLKETRDTHSLYEGVISASSNPREKRKKQKKPLRLNRIKSLIRLFKEEYRYRFGEDRYDTHASGFFGPAVSARLIQPWRASKMNRLFRDNYVQAKDLPKLDYAFFPLHTEPEIVLSVYCKPYLNQIEAIRLFSRNLPVGIKLVVKEHPWAIGKRPLSYYHKILNIPNVRLAHPSLISRELISNARLVAIIAGSIGFEALILKKPVVMLGHAPFEFLPPGMIRYADNPDRLGFEIRELLDQHTHDEHALEAYIAAVINNSVPVDFYTKLLGRKDGYSPNQGEFNQGLFEKERLEHIHLLARYLLDRLSKYEKTA